MNDKELDFKIKEYFDDNKIEPNKNVLNEIKQEIINEEKPKQKLFTFWRTFIATAALLIIITISIVLPIVLKKEDGPNYYTYTDEDVNTIEVEQTVVIDYINNNLSKYSFIFDQCDIERCFGLYTKDENKLVALSVRFIQNNIPFAAVKFDLIIDKRYTFSDDSSFRSESEVVTRNDSLLYLKEKEEIYTTYLYALFEYSNYNLYLYLDATDYDFINQF